MSYFDLTRVAAPSAPAADHMLVFVDTVNRILSTIDEFGLKRRLAADLSFLVTDRHNGTAAKCDGSTDDLAAINALINYVPDGSTILFPAGTCNISGTIAIPSGKHLRFIGCGAFKTIIRTTSGTLDMVTVGDWQNEFRGITFTSTVTRTAGYAINGGTMAYLTIADCNFQNVFNGIFNGGTICSIKDCTWTNTVNFGIQFLGAGVNAIVTGCVMDCSTPTVAHIEVNQCGSLLLANCDLIHAVNNMRLNPNADTLGTFSVNAMNVYFDSANGSSVKYTGSSTNTNNLRHLYINCWFTGTNGVEFATGAANLTSGIDFDNCHFLTNSQNGILATSVAEFGVRNCRIAGNTTAGINISAAAAAATSFIIKGNRIGPTGGISANGTGILINAGTYGSYEIEGNNCLGNTTANITDSGTVSGQNQKFVSGNLGHMLEGGVCAITSAVSVVANANTIVAGGLNICPVPANAIRVQTTIRVTVTGSFTQATAGTAVAVQVHLGTAGTVADAVIATHALTSGVGTSVARLIIDLTFRTIGASGTVASQLQVVQHAAAVVGISAAAGGLSEVQGTTTTAPNTTTANYLTVSILSAASGVTGTTQLGIIEVVQP
jgi:hypothetical protein